MTDLPPAIQLNGVSKVYENKFVRTTAASSVDLTIHSGDFLSIRGASGSGKSTLLSLLGLLIPPTSGSLTYFGQDVSELSAIARARLRNQRIGFVFQAYNLIEDLSVIDNVLLPTTFSRIAIDEPRMHATGLLERVGLSHRIQHSPSELSGGEQQRVAIARSLIMGPSVILADEPTGNLDSQSSTQIMDLLIQINANGTNLVVVTHNDAVAQLARTQLHMQDGKLSRSQTEARAAKPPAPGRGSCAHWH